MLINVYPNNTKIQLLLANKNLCELNISTTFPMQLISGTFFIKLHFYNLTLRNAETVRLRRFTHRKYIYTQS